MAHHCPDCGTVILSRRVPTCGTCRQPLPAEFLFTAAELAAVEGAEKERERQRQLREEKKAAERAASRGQIDGQGG